MEVAFAALFWITNYRLVNYHGNLPRILIEEKWNKCNAFWEDR